MEILIGSPRRGENSTLSELSVDGKRECYILEDKDRGLSSTMSLEGIRALKVKAATAIPAGRYQVTIALSPRFKKLLPRLLNVPGFDGILIHSGNTHQDTEGCLITGKAYVKTGNDYQIKGGTSNPAYQELYAKIQAALKAGQKVFITIDRDYA